MKKITKVKNLPIDSRTSKISISTKKYLDGIKRLREKAMIEKRKLITNNGI